MKKSLGVLLAVIFVFGMAGASALAQETPALAPPSAANLLKASAAGQNKDDKADNKADDIFNVPREGSANDLEKYIKTMLQYRPKNIASQEEMMNFVERRIAAVGTAAELMLAKPDATMEQRILAHQMKMSTILYHAKGDAEKAVADLEKYAEKLTEEEKDAKNIARSMIVQAKIRMARDSEKPIEAFKKVLAEVKSLLEKNPIPEFAIFPFMLMQAAEEIDRDGKEKLDEFVVNEFKPILEKIDSPKIREMLAYMEGTVRFKNMGEGSVLELESVLLDGKTLNLKDLKDKVVLIDVWATWCPPCREELPILKKLYAKYHNYGFEIIGYSVDEDLDALKNFEANDPHPWYVASAVMTTEKGLVDFATHYGIPGYPTMILIGRDGKVISKEARPPELDTMLEKLFPEVK
ncbi:MAG: TlpA family protein disulfide reductase [Planctomycetaceae bacterium]|nr:TlpA family protein disulfide reductase [Planctomycetaceae bacterium]